ncbi:DUF6817 domain-containing protein [Geodermatophilus sp. SYSU D01106]
MDRTAAIAALLRSRGADDVPHPGGTLSAHLERVQRRLLALGAGEDVALAGRAHAVYGTDGFDVVLVDRADRRLVVEAVGERAEALVYRYGGCDRRRTWDSLAATRTAHDRWTGTAEVLGDDDLRAFADLSLVNELDVAEHDPSVLDRYGGLLRRLAESWRPVLGPAVYAEARRVLG